MRAAIYTRVSLADGRQTTENQRQQLTEFCERVGWKVGAQFSDNRTGATTNRLGLTRMMTAASKREFDVLVFWSLDRVSRTGALSVLNLFEQLRSYGVQYRSLQESYLDSAGPFADVFISLLASIAKLERQKISERTLAGLARARKQGRIGGRPRVESDPKLTASITKLRASGHSVRQIAKLLDKSPTTIQKYAA